MKNDPHVGIASVWWEGNPCIAISAAIVETLRSLTLLLGNNHLLGLGQHVKAAVEKSGMIGWQYNTIGVSDAITMGGEGMSAAPHPPSHAAPFSFYPTSHTNPSALPPTRHAIFSANPRDHR